ARASVRAEKLGAPHKLGNCFACKWLILTRCLLGCIYYSCILFPIFIYVRANYTLILAPLVRRYPAPPIETWQQDDNDRARRKHRPRPQMRFSNFAMAVHIGRLLR